MRSLLSFAVLSLSMAALAPAGAETASFTVKVGTKDRNGVCHIYLPREDGLQFELSLRASDANMNVAVHNIPGDWVEGNGTKNIRLTVRPDKGKAVTTDRGDYVAGLTYRAEGWFTEVGKGGELLSALKGGKAFTVSFDGHKLGAFEIQQGSGAVQDYAYDFMQRCIGDKGGNTDF